jgi:hypothetical protein
MTTNPGQQYPYDDHPLQQAAQDSRADRNASLDALHTVEAALAAPAPGRNERWLAEVLIAIDTLLDALNSQAATDSESTSLLSEIAIDQPRFVSRIERLRREHDDLRAALRSLRDQIAPVVGVDVDPADIRDRLASVARRLRQHRAREADLIYEAINLNLGGGD